MSSISILHEFPHGFAARLCEAGAKRAARRLGWALFQQFVAPERPGSRRPPQWPWAPGLGPGSRWEALLSLHPTACSLPAALHLADISGHLTFLEVFYYKCRNCQPNLEVYRNSEGQVIRNVNVATKNYKHDLKVSSNSFLQVFI